MKIFMYERVLLPTVLPKNGSIKTLELTECVRQKIKITPADVKRCNVTVSDGKVNWNKFMDHGIDIDWTQEEAFLIASSLMKADKEENLPNSQGFLSFYKAFFEQYKEFKPKSELKKIN